MVQKSFELATIDPNKTARLWFEAVNVNYEVWVNNIHLGKITGGYFPHYFDITNIIKEGENDVTVRVDNNYRTGAYCSWGGIRRSVELVINELSRIDKMLVSATPNLGKGDANIDISYEIFDANRQEGKYTLEYEISQNENRIIRKSVSANKVINKLNVLLPKKSVKLWHFDSPILYTLNVRLLKNNQLVYEKQERFGIRKITLSRDQFLLNGESVRLLGYNWVADDRFTGNTLPTEMYKRHIDLMKQAGCNMTRLSHVPLPKDVLDYIDEVGMLVIDEIQVWGRSEFTRLDNPTSKEWQIQMVHTHFNHPCIVGWSVGNELGNLAQNPEASEYVRKAIEYVSSLDPLRPAMDVSNSAYWQKNDPSQHSQGMLALNLYMSDWGNKSERC